MALKEVFHVIATELPLDSDTFGDTIPSGRIVVLNAAGNVILPTVHAGVPMGIAGDTNAQAFTNAIRNPESANVVMGAWHTTTSGTTRWTQNRVADNYNETAASSLITVYQAGGEFWNDQYATVQANGAAAGYAPGDLLYFVTPDRNANALAGQVIHNAAATESDWAVGAVIGEPQALPSGVPGTEVEGSLSFGTFLHMTFNVSHVI